MSLGTRLCPTIWSNKRKPLVRQMVRCDRAMGGSVIRAWRWVYTVVFVRTTIRPLSAWFMVCDYRESLMAGGHRQSAVEKRSIAAVGHNRRAGGRSAFYRPTACCIYSGWFLLICHFYLPHSIIVPSFSEHRQCIHLCAAYCACCTLTC